MPTPIGNLQDITLRAIETLREVELILCEDTRVSGKLLKHLGIQAAMQSYHAHNEHQSTERWIDKMHSGATIALISDAGTPALSDPGFLLVREAIAHDIVVESLPGPSALLPALTASGLPCDRFIFEGFLPQKKGRQKKLQSLTDEERTMVFYESPYRLMKALEQMKEVFGGDRLACVARELSKLYEEYQRGSLSSLIEFYTDKQIKGEIVIVVAGKPS